MISQPDWVNFTRQRPNYFPGQYLLDEDFELAHRYLSDRQRYVNSRLHLSGIVEGLEVEAIAGQPEVIIKSGTAIDGEGNLIILGQAVSRKINALGWLCLRYHQEAKILQQPEIPDSFTRFEENPLLTLEAIETRDEKTIILAKVTLEDGQVQIDNSVRQYSGVRLPSSNGEAIALNSNGQSLTIQGNLTLFGVLQINDSSLNAISQAIDLEADLTDIVPSEKAVKEHIERRITEGLNANQSAYTLALSNPMRHRMYPNDPLVYQDIFEAKEAGVIEKYNQVENYDDTSHSTKNSLWCGRRAICFGSQEVADRGAAVTVPEGYDTLWVRISAADKWYSFRAEFLDGDKEILGYWTGGRRNANCYCPDGSLADSYHNRHQWIPIPVGRPGRVLLVEDLGSRSDGGLWFTGLGFSKNPWAHATQSALGYHWTVNGGDATNWQGGNSKEGNSDDWHGDIYTIIPRDTTLKLKVPYVWSGRDKLLYMVEHNNDWNGCMHNGITVNGQPVERFLASYDSPFARHWNSKSYNRYIAARIPAELIPRPQADQVPLLEVTIDMTKQNGDLHFREMGTHDLEVPELDKTSP
ncbi:hypothetical protein PN462_19440 [Spirulina sp. CS-785/01]|uniref:hypothetical protein n=1 Tax=Spirulina sp. CS-785/01 TaxID=3021716 RepID=UPI00232D4854|nr:hypothetical protein [Spirulina sp. CS-785/01]MDB9315298.1 hypothetical protein [Spirulina sp. CS-785/01]